MSTLSPPVQLEKTENQGFIDWIQDYASAPDFDYPSKFYEYTEALWKDRGVQVCRHFIYLFINIVLYNITSLQS